MSLQEYDGFRWAQYEVRRDLEDKTLRHYVCIGVFRNGRRVDVHVIGSPKLPVLERADHLMTAKRLAAQQVESQGGTYDWKPNYTMQFDELPTDAPSE